jgi:hypothetical protein
LVVLLWVVVAWVVSVVVLREVSAVPAMGLIVPIVEAPVEAPPTAAPVVAPTSPPLVVVAAAPVEAPLALLSLRFPQAPAPHNATSAPTAMIDLLRIVLSFVVTAQGVPSGPVEGGHSLTRDGDGDGRGAQSASQRIRLAPDSG